MLSGSRHSQKKKRKTILSSISSPACKIHFAPVALLRPKTFDTHAGVHAHTHTYEKLGMIYGSPTPARRQVDVILIELSGLMDGVCLVLLISSHCAHRRAPPKGRRFRGCVTRQERTGDKLSH